jgi:hypothetical protein
LLCRDMRESISSAHIHHQEEVHTVDLPVTCSIGPASSTWAGCAMGGVEGNQVGACVVEERHSPRCSGAARRSSQQRTDKYTQLGVFWCISRGLTGFACGCSCHRGAVSQVLASRAGYYLRRTPSLPRCGAACDLAGPLRPAVAWGHASDPSGHITPIQCIGLRSRCRHPTRASVSKLTRNPRRQPRRPGAAGLAKAAAGRARCSQERAP